MCSASGRVICSRVLVVTLRILSSSPSSSSFTAFLCLRLLGKSEIFALVAAPLCSIELQNIVLHFPQFLSGESLLSFFQTRPIRFFTMIIHAARVISNLIICAEQAFMRLGRYLFIALYCFTLLLVAALRFLTWKSCSGSHQLNDLCLNLILSVISSMLSIHFAINVLSFWKRTIVFYLKFFNANFVEPKCQTGFRYVSSSFYSEDIKNYIFNLCFHKNSSSWTRS